ncbi:FHA domain-containing protein [Kineosporia sp. NBRC 101731]|uniref:FHA domain-containing protein FhaB/FipA n=1 Tax=Kineosporia sp. NBRC 101731 TaxID=3032199 RepID=UPI0024A0E5DA|nr:FHA domain-containing protein [Kineosporia sp. NBRC 101731]GLY26784.1 phosphopeptide-binding protein [Kineosporia sp. NBRC 101731]
MSELTLTLLRLGFLALLWLLVLSVVAVMRRDLFNSPRVSRRPATAAVPAMSGGGGRSQPQQQESPPLPTTLVVTAGSLKGTTIPLGQAPILIGRTPESTLVLDDDYASGRHARLSLRHGVWMVEDLGSTNGTFLGRNRVQDPVPIAPGAQIRIGRTVLELRR